MFLILILVPLVFIPLYPLNRGQYHWDIMDNWLNIWLNRDTLLSYILPCRNLLDRFTLVVSIIMLNFIMQNFQPLIFKMMIGSDIIFVCGNVAPNPIHLPTDWCDLFYYCWAHIYCVLNMVCLIGYTEWYNTYKASHMIKSTAWVIQLSGCVPMVSIIFHY